MSILGILLGEPDDPSPCPECDGPIINTGRQLRRAHNTPDCPAIKLEWVIYGDVYRVALKDDSRDYEAAQ